MTHLTIHEWGRVPVGDGGFTRLEADRLLAAARAHSLGGADGTDILCDHHRFLRARQMVGVIAAHGCSLEILPKVDPDDVSEANETVRGRLIHMLDVAIGLGISTGESSSMARKADSLLEVFIALFSDRLLGEVRRGLPRHYREHDEELRALRGKLDVVRQFTINAVRPDRLACRFDALVSDTPLMQVMKACVLLLGRHARRSETQRKLSELRFLLADVSEVPRSALPWKQVRIDRGSQRWRSLLDLARLFLASDWQGTHAKERSPEGITLLFPMNLLFERYVAVQLRRALQGTELEVVAQGGFRYALGPWNDGAQVVGDSHLTRPDILVRRKGKVVAILDTKWKHSAKGVSHADLYQMMAYAALYECRQLVLLYPTTPGDGSETTSPKGTSTTAPFRLDVATVPLHEPVAQIQSALRGLELGSPAALGGVGLRH